MCKKLIYLTTFVMVLGLVGSASADLVMHWKFDEGAGDIAVDEVGNVVGNVIKDVGVPLECGITTILGIP